MTILTLGFCTSINWPDGTLSTQGYTPYTDYHVCPYMHQLQTNDMRAQIHAHSHIYGHTLSHIMNK